MSDEEIKSTFILATEAYDNGKYKKALKLYKKFNRLEYSAYNYTFKVISKDKAYLLEALIFDKLGDFYGALNAFEVVLGKIPHTNEVIEKSKRFLSSPRFHEYMLKRVGKPTSISEIILKINDDAEKGRMLMLYDRKYSFFMNPKSDQYVLEELANIFPNEQFLLDSLDKIKSEATAEEPVSPTTGETPKTEISDGFPDDWSPAAKNAFKMTMDFQEDLFKARALGKEKEFLKGLTEKKTQEEAINSITNFISDFTREKNSENVLDIMRKKTIFLPGNFRELVEIVLDHPDKKKTIELMEMVAKGFSDYNDDDKIIQVHENLVKEFPENEFIWKNLRDLYEVVYPQDIEKQVESNKKLLSINQNNGSALTKLTGLSFKKGNFKDVIHYGERAFKTLQLHGKNEKEGIPILKLMQFAYTKENQNLEKSRIIEKIVKLDPNDAEAWEDLGEVSFLLNKRNLLKPIRCFTKALEIDPTRYSTMRGLGLSYFIFGKHEKAIPFLESYLEKFPDDIDVKDTLSEIKK